MQRALVASIALTWAIGVEAQDRIVSEARVAAPLAAVWGAWTTDEGLRSWLAPHASIDLRVGGSMRANYLSDGVLGDARTIENAVLSFDPERMLSIRVISAPDDFPFAREVESMWSVIYFEEAGNDETLVRVVSVGFGADEPSQRMRAFFQQGNAATLEQLQQRFATGR